jgi:hypothetical protein
MLYARHLPTMTVVAINDLKKRCSRRRCLSEDHRWPVNAGGSCVRAAKSGTLHRASRVPYDTYSRRSPFGRMKLGKSTALCEVRKRWWHSCKRSHVHFILLPIVLGARMRDKSASPTSTSSIASRRRPAGGLKLQQCLSAFLRDAWERRWRR